MTSDSDRAAPHLGPGPVAGRALDLDRASDHPRAQPRPNVAPDLNPTRHHAASEPADRPEVPLEDQVTVAAVPFEAEQLPQFDRTVAYGDTKPGDLGRPVAQGLRAKAIPLARGIRSGRSRSVSGA